MAVAVTKQEELELDVRMIPLSDIKANANIREVDKTSEKFKELVASVEEKGVLEPVLVRPFVPTGFQLVCGYWRYDAAKAAGLKAIPARVKELTDAQVIEVQLIENLQRSEMSEIDEAHAFKAYLEVSKATQAELAKRIGKSQPYIANRMRLLGLSAEAQAHIRDGIISASHGEVLLKIPKEIETQQIALAKGAGARKLTVSELSHEVDRVVQGHKEKQKIEALIKEHGHGKCPACGARPVRMSYYGSDMVQCASYHDWNIKTGKDRDAEFRDRQRARTVRTAKATRKAPPPEPKTWRSPHDASVIVKSLVRSLGDATISRVRLESNYGSGGELRISLSKMPVKGLQFVVEPQAYSTGERSRVEAVGWNDGKRKEMRLAFESWSKAALPKPKAIKGEKKQADPKILEGSIDQVCMKLPKDPELLETLRALEMKGKKRKSLLDHLDLKLSMRR